MPETGIELRAERLFYNQKEVKPSVRKVGDMLGVLADREFASKAGKLEMERIVYWMFRGLETIGNVRYDITLVSSAGLGKELPKTVGHYHPLEGSQSYPEIYEVLEGEAHYLLQKQESAEAFLIKAKKGDKVIIPPDYGHVTINPGKTPLLMANLVSDEFDSDYSDYAAMSGGSYYEMSGGKLVANRKYGERRLMLYSAKEFAKNFKISRKLAKATLLELVKKDPALFGFLDNPALLE